MTNARILLATGNAEQRVAIGKYLRHAGNQVVDCDIEEELSSWCDAHDGSRDVDLAFLDCRVLLSEEDILPRIEKTLNGTIPVVILTSYACRRICFRTSPMKVAAYMPPPVTQTEVEKMVDDLLLATEKEKAEKEVQVPSEPLTPRERIIIRLLVRGLDNDEIARCLGISSETVHYHLKHVYEKLRVKSRTEAAAVARAISMASSPGNGKETGKRK